VSVETRAKVSVRFVNRSGIVGYVRIISRRITLRFSCGAKENLTRVNALLDRAAIAPSVPGFVRPGSFPGEYGNAYSPSHHIPLTCEIARSARLRSPRLPAGMRRCLHHRSARRTQAPHFLPAEAATAMRALRIPAAASREPRVTNVAQTIWRKLRSTWLPAETNRPAEFSVPHPTRISREPRNRATARQNNRWPIGFPVDLLRKKASRVFCNSSEFLGCGLWPEVVW
jgi:hypothetical protein